MTSNKEQTESRRQFLKNAACAAAIGPFFVFRRWPGGNQGTLKVARWAHFLPEYDRWFEDVFIKEWSAKHNTNVKVDTIPVEKIAAAASAETAAGKGHDLFMFPWPPAEYYQHAIDHTEVYFLVGARHGNTNRIGHKSTFDPKTKKYFAFCDSWMPTPVHYYEDDWSKVGIPFGPGHYDSLRSGGSRVREKLGVPCGLAMGSNLEGNITLHTLLYAFRGSVLDATGNVTVNNFRTIEALRYVKALTDVAGSKDQLAWGPSENVRAMLAGKTSCTINAISLLREAEKQNPDIAKRIMVSPPLLGPAGSMATPFVTSCSTIWSFAENKDGAKQFLADFVDSFRTAYAKSGGCSFPIYQNTVPNLIKLLQNDPAAVPSYKYVRLKDALHWTPNLGFPGFANPVSMEAFNTFVIPKMFQSVVKGEASPEDAARAAESEVKRISDKWKHISDSPQTGR